LPGRNVGERGRNDAARPRLSRAQFLRLAAGGMLASTLRREAAAQSSPRSIDTMRERAIPSTGEPLPVVGCGTWRGFDVDAGERSALLDVLAALFEAGGSVIDSSPMYGAAEATVGDLLARMQARQRAFIATKVWTRGREAGIKQMRRSAELLNAEVIDLMQVHNLVDWRTQLATLREWKAEGRVRYVGVTHYTPSAFDDLEAVMRAETLDFVQLDYALDERDAEQRLLPLAAARGIAVLVNRPFGGGRLLSRLARRPLPAWAAEIDCTSWAQVLLKFVLSNPAVTCVIPGTGNPAHMRDNVLAGIGRLPDASLRERIAQSI
jgi:diketogulonate reductase-like aldo/keto reductase